MQPPPEAKEFRCSSCGKAFGRAEHLRRHELIHNEDRPFNCRYCPKSFIRRDALSRHEATHNSAPSLLQRGGRACGSCAAAKARCTGEQQCVRCRERNLHCTYPGPPLASPVGPAQESHFHSRPVPQPPVFHMPVNGMQTPDPSMMDFDLWDPNILSSTNWLEVLDPADFTQFAFEGYGSLGDQTQHRPQPSQVQAQLPPVHLQSPPQHTDLRSLGQSASPGSVFSTHSNAVTDSLTSQESPSQPGEYYVDGEPARLPRVKRRKTSTSRRSVADPQSVTTFSLQAAGSIQASESGHISIAKETYDNLKDSYVRFCIEPRAPWPAFENTEFPSQVELESLVGLYFTHFDQALPFVHRYKFNTATQDRLLALTMAALGSHYTDADKTPTGFTASLHEFAHRYIAYQTEASRAQPAAPKICGGAYILHIIGCVYSGDQRLIQSALGLRSHLADALEDCRRNLYSVPTRQAPVSPDLDTKWQIWCQQEEHIRVAYSAWLVDTMLTYHLRSSSTMSLKECSLDLPCNEKLWYATNAQEWDALKALRETSNPSLSIALQELYVEKKLPRDRGEFARILIIHGLFQRLWEVERYFENPLSQWQPTASRQSSQDELPKTPIWLPSIPTFTRWQNSACDALDVLHWQANATIGQNSGLEHPTVMHLHLARIILLTPHIHIVELARAMTTGFDQTEHAKAKQLAIQRWAVQHQYKARLAVIHAGVVFWHIRRYTVDAFYEPAAVGLAALVLWAFGSFTDRKQALSRSTSRPPPEAPEQRRTQLHSQAAPEEAEHSDEASCEIILIDRPTDDELVQQFIRHGHSMQAHLTGVGDLYGPRGPEKALVQGTKLLSAMRCWGVSVWWQQLLQGLVEATRKSRPSG